MRHLKLKELPGSKTWIDKDIIMLHACFQCLVDYIEVEEGLVYLSYSAHKGFIDEAKALYKWWQERLKVEDFDDMEKDTEMLLRLIKIRGGLWT